MKDAIGGRKSIVFPVYDLPTKIIEFGNGAGRVTTVTYEIKCHSDNFTLLKNLLIKLLVLDPIPPSNSNIHFTPTV